MRTLSKSTISIPVLSIFFTLAAATAVLAAVPPQLASARSAAEQGRHPDAVSLYEEFIAGHPMMQTVFVSKDEHLPPSQVHELLLAFAELTELQRDSGDEQNRRSYLDKLDWLRRNHSISTINLYHLARVYLDNGRTGQGLESLEKIAGDQERFPQKDHNKVYLRACARMLKIHAQQDHPDKVNSVLERMRRSLVLFDYDLRDRYKIARLFLEHGAPAKAEQILADIAKETDPAALRSEEFTIIRASIKLLEVYAERDDNRAIDRLLKKLGEKYADRPMSSHSQHLLVLAMDRVGASVEAFRLLELSR